MIDLNYKPKKSTEQQEQGEPPLIVTFLMLLPFGFLFWVLLTTSFLHGIY